MSIQGFGCRSTTIKRIMMPTNEVSAIINLDDDDNDMIPSNNITTAASSKAKVCRPSVKNSTNTIASDNVPIQSSNVTISTNFNTKLYRPDVGGPTLASPNSKATVNSQLHSGQLVKKGRNTVKSSRTLKIGPEVVNGEETPNTELIRLHKYLAPATRKLINKLRYFEMNDGTVYKVTISSVKVSEMLS